MGRSEVTMLDWHALSWRCWARVRATSTHRQRRRADRIANLSFRYRIDAAEWYCGLKYERAESLCLRVELGLWSESTDWRVFQPGVMSQSFLFLFTSDGIALAGPSIFR